MLEETSVHDVLRTTGTPLPAPLRTEMESRLGADFSDVRLHSGPAAQRSATEIGARAYTSGSHVVIGENASDKHTLAHELTHVIQQRQGPVAGTDNGSGLRVSDPSDPYEREAEANAARALASPFSEPGEVQCAVPVNSAQDTFVQRVDKGKRRADEIGEGQPSQPGQVPADVFEAIYNRDFHEDTYDGGRGRKIAKSPEGAACWQWALRALEESGGLDRQEFWSYLSGWGAISENDLNAVTQAVRDELDQLLMQLQEAGMSKGPAGIDTFHDVQEVHVFMERSVRTFVKAHGFQIADSDPAGWIMCNYKVDRQFCTPDHFWIELPGPERKRVLIQTVPSKDFLEAGRLELRWSDPGSVKARRIEVQEHMLIEVPVKALKGKHIDTLKKVFGEKAKRTRRVRDDSG